MLGTSAAVQGSVLLAILLRFLLAMAEQRRVRPRLLSPDGPPLGYPPPFPPPPFPLPPPPLPPPPAGFAQSSTGVAVSVAAVAPAGSAQSSAASMAASDSAAADVAASAPSGSAQSCAGSAQEVQAFPPRSEVLVYSHDGQLVVVCNADTVANSRWVGSDTTQIMDWFWSIGCRGVTGTYQHVADITYCVKENVTECHFGGYSQDADFSVTCAKCTVNWVQDPLSGNPRVVLPRTFIGAAIGGNQQRRERMMRVALCLALYSDEAFDESFNANLSHEVHPPQDLQAGYMDAIQQFTRARQQRREQHGALPR